MDPEVGDRLDTIESELIRLQKQNQQIIVRVQKTQQVQGAILTFVFILLAVNTQLIPEDQQGAVIGLLVTLAGGQASGKLDEWLDKIRPHKSKQPE